MGRRENVEKGLYEVKYHSWNMLVDRCLMFSEAVNNCGLAE